MATTESALAHVRASLMRRSRELTIGMLPGAEAREDDGRSANGTERKPSPFTSTTSADAKSLSPFSVNGEDAVHARGGGSAAAQIPLSCSARSDSTSHDSSTSIIAGERASPAIPPCPTSPAPPPCVTGPHSPPHLRASLLAMGASTRSGGRSPREGNSIKAFTGSHRASVHDPLWQSPSSSRNTAAATRRRRSSKRRQADSSSVSPPQQADGRRRSLGADRGKTEKDGFVMYDKGLAEAMLSTARRMSLAEKRGKIEKEEELLQGSTNRVRRPSVANSSAPFAAGELIADADGSTEHDEQESGPTYSFVMAADFRAFGSPAPHSRDDALPPQTPTCPATTGSATSPGYVGRLRASVSSAATLPISGAASPLLAPCWTARRSSGRPPTIPGTGPALPTAGNAAGSLRHRHSLSSSFPSQRAQGKTNPVALHVGSNPEACLVTAQGTSAPDKGCPPSAAAADAPQDRPHHGRHRRQRHSSSHQLSHKTLTEAFYGNYASCTMARDAYLHFLAEGQGKRRSSSGNGGNGGGGGAASKGRPSASGRSSSVLSATRGGDSGPARGEGRRATGLPPRRCHDGSEQDVVAAEDRGHGGWGGVWPANESVCWTPASSLSVLISPLGPLPSPPQQQQQQQTRHRSSAAAQCESTNAALSAAVPPFSPLSTPGARPHMSFPRYPPPSPIEGGDPHQARRVSLGRHHQQPPQQPQQPLLPQVPSTTPKDDRIQALLQRAEALYKASLKVVE